MYTYYSYMYISLELAAVLHVRLQPVPEAPVGINPILYVCVTETPPVSLRLPSGSFSDLQTGAPERQARRVLPAPACVCVPLDAAVTL